MSYIYINCFIIFKRVHDHTFFYIGQLLIRLCILNISYCMHTHYPPNFQVYKYNSLFYHFSKQYLLLKNKTKIKIKIIKIKKIFLLI